jgi:urea transport system substrate-binding protein
MSLLSAAVLLAGCTADPVKPTVVAGSDNTISVAILHSLSGDLAGTEIAVRDAELFAIDEINARGGLLGKQLAPIVEDGASDAPTFAEKAEKLISQNKVAATFGGWTSASRKAMLPVFERNKALLWYPISYEGLESSPYIFYTGASANQQIVPGLDYLKQQGKKKIFLVGDDDVFPQTVDKIINAYAAANGMTIVGEAYPRLGQTDYSTVVKKLGQTKPDAVFSTLNGDSSAAYFAELRRAGINAKTMPTLTVGVAEKELGGKSARNLAGHLVAWSYYQSTPGASNAAFVKAYKAMYGPTAVTSDPVEAGYNAVKLWAAAVTKAGTTEVGAVKAAAAGLSLKLPEGTVTIDGENQHVYRTARIGRVRPDGRITETWNSGKPIKPDPYLKGFAWAVGLS